VSGDEFAVVLLEIDDMAAVSAIADKILKEVAMPLSIEGNDVAITVSIGACAFPDHGTTGEDLLKNADTAMYGAKQAGRNRICFYKR